MKVSKLEVKLEGLGQVSRVPDAQKRRQKGRQDYEA